MRPAIEQLQPVPFAFPSALNDPAGNGSVTVTVDPSVARFPTLETASANVVASPPTKLPVWLLESDRLGAATVSITCGDVSRNGVPSVSPLKFAVAWLTICCPGLSSALIVTSNVTVSVSAGAILPPDVAFPPVPSRKITLFVAGLNSPGSSPSASVGFGFVAASGPAVMCRVPGVYVVPDGIASRITKLTAESEPVFV